MSVSSSGANHRAPQTLICGIWRLLFGLTQARVLAGAMSFMLLTSLLLDRTSRRPEPLRVSLCCVVGVCGLTRAARDNSRHDKARKMSAAGLLVVITSSAACIRRNRARLELPKHRRCVAGFMQEPPQTPDRQHLLTALRRTLNDHPRQRLHPANARCICSAQFCWGWCCSQASRPPAVEARQAPRRPRHRPLRRRKDLFARRPSP
mmetsp:Transcript_23361/g.55486  ORF Transcript_23361/g.55486 Transcript_23361/m.55486 type:complete len:206 (+) Transcript_23361:3273-3890(+)